MYLAEDMALDKKKFKILTPVRVIAIGFALIIFVGAFFLSLPIAHNDGQWFSFMDSLFTSTSAVCYRFDCCRYGGAL